MAVGPGEPLIALAAELSAGVTPAPPVGAAGVGRNQTHPVRSAVGGHGHGAAADHCGGGGDKLAGRFLSDGARGDGWGRTSAGRRAAVVLQQRAVPAFVVLGTSTGVVGRQVEAPPSVLTRSVEAVIDVQLRAEDRC